MGEAVRQIKSSINHKPVAANTCDIGFVLWTSLMQSVLKLNSHVWQSVLSNYEDCMNYGTIDSTDLGLQLSQMQPRIQPYIQVWLGH